MKCSKVTFFGGWIIKEQPKTLTENEYYCLRKLYPSGFVPYAERIEPELLRIEFIRFEPVTDPAFFISFGEAVLEALKKARIRHGDLTEYAVIPRGNKPFLIDFAESRLWNDPRPDKRPEGDRLWLYQTMRKYAEGTFDGRHHIRE